jgi:hypothetical protein
MTTCMICRFDVPLDDAVFVTAGGRCVCLLCYGRETGSHLPLPKALRREVSGLLNAVQTA